MVIDDMEEKDIKLKETCSLCPEQYEAFYNGKQVGYLRLRHGYFYVAYPDCGGKLIYEGFPEGEGCFEDSEREYSLSMAKKAIIHEITKIEEAS